MIAWHKQVSSKTDLCYCSLSHRQTSVLNGICLARKHQDTASSTKSAAKYLLPLLSDVFGRQNLRPLRPNMASDEDLSDPELKAAIAASLQSSEGPGDSNGPAPSEDPKGVVDLTADSDDDVVEVYPKSKSVVGSESEDEEVEDEELRRAIQMSIRASEEADSNDDDNDDTALKKTIQMSLQNELGNGNDASKPETSGNEEDDSTDLPSRAKEDSTPKPKPSQTTPLSGLDRKQMEQERLARLAKRKAKEAPTSQPEAKQTRTETLPSGIRGSKSPPRSPKKGNNLSSDGKSKTQPGNPSPTPSVQFPTGVVKKTWNRHCPRNGDDIKIEEVFQASDLELAVLSSFMWDMEWIFSNMDTKNTRFLLIMQAKEESTVCLHPLSSRLY